MKLPEQRPLADGGRAMTIGRGDLSIFATRPLSDALLLCALLLLVAVLLPAVRRRREDTFQGD